MKRLLEIEMIMLIDFMHPVFCYLWFCPLCRDHSIIKKNLQSIQWYLFVSYNLDANFR